MFKIELNWATFVIQLREKYIFSLTGVEKRIEKFVAKERA